MKNYLSIIMAVSIIFVGAVTPAKADIDTVYQITVGKKMSHVFKGGAHKVVVTSLTGAVELKVKFFHGREQTHKIRCNPKCSKTMRSNRIDGIVNVQAKSKSGPKATLKIEIDKGKNHRCRIPSDCGAAEGWTVYEY